MKWNSKNTNNNDDDLKYNKACHHLIEHSQNFPYKGNPVWSHSELSQTCDTSAAWEDNFLSDIIANCKIKRLECNHVFSHH